jgi:hypothetical protein
VPRVRADRTSAAIDAIMAALLERGELTLAECADAAGAKHGRAGAILYVATIRGHVSLRLDRGNERHYSITAAGRDAFELLRLARERLPKTNPERARIATQRRVA